MDDELAALGGVAVTDGRRESSACKLPCMLSTLTGLAMGRKPSWHGVVGWYRRVDLRWRYMIGYREADSAT